MAHKLCDAQHNVCLYIDIMYVNGMPFLTTISKKIKYLTAMWVTDCNAPLLHLWYPYSNYTNRKVFMPPKSSQSHNGEISRGKWMQQLKIWIVIKQSTNLELNEPGLEWE